MYHGVLDEDNENEFFPSYFRNMNIADHPPLAGKYIDYKQ